MCEKKQKSILQQILQAQDSKEIFSIKNKIVGIQRNQEKNPCQLNKEDAGKTNLIKLNRFFDNQKQIKDKWSKVIKIQEKKFKTSLKFLKDLEQQSNEDFGKIIKKTVGVCKDVSSDIKQLKKFKKFTVGAFKQNKYVEELWSKNQNYILQKQNFYDMMYPKKQETQEQNDYLKFVGIKNMDQLYEQERSRQEQVETRFLYFLYKKQKQCEIQDKLNKQQQLQNRSQEDQMQQIESIISPQTDRCDYSPIKTFQRLDSLDSQQDFKRLTMPDLQLNLHKKSYSLQNQTSLKSFQKELQNYHKIDTDNIIPKLSKRSIKITKKAPSYKNKVKLSLNIGSSNYNNTDSSILPTNASYKEDTSRNQKQLYTQNTQNSDIIQQISEQEYSQVQKQESSRNQEIVSPHSYITSSSPKKKENFIFKQPFRISDIDPNITDRRIIKAYNLIDHQQKVTHHVMINDKEEDHPVEFKDNYEQEQQARLYSILQPLSPTDLYFKNYLNDILSKYGHQMVKNFETDDFWKQLKQNERSIPDWLKRLIHDKKIRKAYEDDLTDPKSVKRQQLLRREVQRIYADKQQDVNELQAHHQMVGDEIKNSAQVNLRFQDEINVIKEQYNECLEPDVNSHRLRKQWKLNLDRTQVHKFKSPFKSQTSRNEKKIHQF